MSKMITLFHPDHPEAGVKTVDQVAADVLRRKQWAEVPEPPEHDAGTHEARFQNGEWLIFDKAPAPVPQSITPRQLQLWLRRNGRLTDARAIINNIPDADAKADAQIEWNTAKEILRDHQLTIKIIKDLGMTPKQGDQAFREASLL